MKVWRIRQFENRPAALRAALEAGLTKQRVEFRAVWDATVRQSVAAWVVRTEKPPAHRFMLEEVETL